MPTTLLEAIMNCEWYMDEVSYLVQIRVLNTAETRKETSLLLGYFTESLQSRVVCI